MLIIFFVHVSLLNSKKRRRREQVASGQTKNNIKTNSRGGLNPPMSSRTVSTTVSDRGTRDCSERWSLRILNRPGSRSGSGEVVTCDPKRDIEGDPPFARAYRDEREVRGELLASRGPPGS